MPISSSKTIQTMKPHVFGLHHVTTMTTETQGNVDFYTQVLGLRMIKVTVNFDDPTTYHLYYGDAVGTPGSAITFFPWRNLAPRRPGAGEIETTAYTIPMGAADWWAQHLEARQVTPVERIERFGAHGLRFRDSGDSTLELIEGEPEGDFRPWPDSPVPMDQQIRGFHGATAWVRHAEPTARLLTEVFGLEAVAAEGNRTRYGLPGKKDGTHFDLVEDPSLPPARHGAGTVHHLAWRVPDDATHATTRAAIEGAGFSVTPIIDRQYFHSIYLRDPNGLLFEVATDNPGFTVDEPLDELGAHLHLPPQYEPHRATIEAALPPLKLAEKATQPLS